MGDNNTSWEELGTKLLLRYSLLLLVTVTLVLESTSNDVMSNHLILHIYFQSNSLQSCLLPLITVTSNQYILFEVNGNSVPRATGYTAPATALVATVAAASMTAPLVAAAPVNHASLRLLPRLLLLRRLLP